MVQKLRKEEYVSKPENNRVLGRTGTRELTAEEVALVSGGLEHTNVITINPYTGQRDGDG
jgi:hypothetical protein